MTSVLTAVRDTTEKVGRGDRRVPPARDRGPAARRPSQSGVEFTVEGDAIRFGLLAVKNVGQGAIESIIAARDEGGEFRSLDRLLLAGRPAAGQPAVLESLAQGRRAQRASATRRSSCSALDDALAAGQAAPARPDHRPDSLFDIGRRAGGARRAAAADARGADPRAAALGEGAPRAVPVGPPARRGRRARSAVRDRLLGRPARRVARPAARRRRRHRHRRPRRSSRRRGRRWRSPRSRTSRAALEVVVFPRLYEETAGDLARGRDPARRRPGRPQGRGGLAPRGLAIDWDDALARGPEGFARDVAAGDRRAVAGRRGQRQRRVRRSAGGPTARRGERAGGRRPGPGPVSVGRPAQPRAVEAAVSVRRRQSARSGGAAPCTSRRRPPAPTDRRPAADRPGRAGPGATSSRATWPASTPDGRRAAAPRRGTRPGSREAAVRRRCRSRPAAGQVLHVRFAATRRHRAARWRRSAQVLRDRTRARPGSSLHVPAGRGRAGAADGAPDRGRLRRRAGGRGRPPARPRARWSSSSPERARRSAAVGGRQAGGPSASSSRPRRASPGRPRSGR